MEGPENVSEPHQEQQLDLWLYRRRIKIKDKMCMIGWVLEVIKKIQKKRKREGKGRE